MFMFATTHYRNWDVLDSLLQGDRIMAHRSEMTVTFADPHVSLRAPIATIEETLAELRRRDPSEECAKWSRWEAYLYLQLAGIRDDVAEHGAEKAYKAAIRMIDSGAARQQDDRAEWFLGKAFGEACWALRREKRHRSLDEVAPPEHWDRDPESNNRLNLIEPIEKTLGHLPDRVREAIVSHYWDDNSYRAMARALGISDHTVKKLVMRGLELLRPNLFSMLAATQGA
jgi:RNA polymerase sigma factor (sigma-70 family)